MIKIREVFERGEGILQMIPTWVPRPFNRPGKRIRRHTDASRFRGVVSLGVLSASPRH